MTLTSRKSGDMMGGAASPAVVRGHYVGVVSSRLYAEEMGV